MNKDIKAVIFDMDGLLLDTETIALQAFEQACTSCGISIKKSVYFQCIGTNSTTSKEILIKGYGEDFPFEDISRLWAENYHQLAILKPVSLKSGAEWLLKGLLKKNIPTAVATSTEQKHAIIKLKNAKIIDYFKFIIAGDQVSEGKPAPEIYQKAAFKLNIAPENCLALEDSENGVRAAHAAGMTVFQIPDLAEPSDEIKSLGHSILTSLFDVGPYLKI